MSRTLALEAHSRGLMASRSGLAVGPNGYVSSFEENLLEGVLATDFEADLTQGSGHELASKFRAPHSSSALVANSFGPFRRHPDDLFIGDLHGLQIVGFEKKCATAVRRGSPPNLDLVLEHADGIVAVESKCTEYLSPHRAKFASAYRQQISGAVRESAWFAEMLRLLEAPDDFRWLDVAQLIKHAFGLAQTYPDRAVTLLYLYWEPSNAVAHPAFSQHRSEIARFAARVTGASPTFAAMSYADLWEQWASNAPPPWLAQHIQNLTARYALPI